MNKRYIVLIDPSISPLPLTGEVADTDLWPSPEATEQYFDNVIALVERGFKGVRIKVADTSDGSFIAATPIDLSSPEGRMVGCLGLLASAGNQPPTCECMAILERVYREQHLPLPSPQTDAGEGAK